MLTHLNFLLVILVILGRKSKVGVEIEQGFGAGPCASRLSPRGWVTVPRTGVVIPAGAVYGVIAASAASSSLIRASAIGSQ